MLAYLAKRLLLALLTTWAISVIAFVIILLPEGDVIDYIRHGMIGVGLAGNENILTEAQADVFRKEYGLDRPIYWQYVRWIHRMSRGNFGYSYRLEVPVRGLLGERLMFTLVVGFSTVLFTWVLAIPIGIYSAVRRQSVGDYTFTFLGFIGLAVPDFLLGLVLMYIAFAYFGWSVGGLFSPDYLSAPWSLARVWDLLKHLWIPAIVLGTAGTAYLIRVMRNNLLDELGKPYVVTARAKGMRGWRVVLKYPVRVALNPLVSVIGYLLPRMIGGSIIVSVVLSLPTLGPLLLDALLAQDPYLAGTIVLALGALTVIGTLISDILLVIVDPRIKLTSPGGG